MASYSKESRQEFVEEINKIFNEHDLKEATKICIRMLIDKINDLQDRLENLEDRQESTEEQKYTW